MLAHDVTFLGRHVEKGADVNLEILFNSPDLLSVIGSPRPHIGADINTAGNTSDGYFGLTWGISLIQNLFNPGDSVFINGSLGGAVRTGSIDRAPPAASGSARPCCSAKAPSSVISSPRRSASRRCSITSRTPIWRRAMPASPAPAPASD